MDPHGNGLPPQSVSQAEVEQKKLAAMQAMMDDLGMARVDQLPLDDGRQDRGHGHHGHNTANNARHDHSIIFNPRRRQQQSAAPRNQPAPGSLAGVAQLWKHAMEAGDFDDDDAEAVKGLDDLGGGRIYQNTTSNNSQVQRVALKTVKILEQRNKRSIHDVSDPAAPNKKVRLSDEPGKYAGPMTAPKLQVGLSAKSQTSDAPAAPAANAPIDKADSNHTEFSIPKDAAHVVDAKLLDGTNRMPVATRIVLSREDRPLLGFFTVFAYRKKYCSWPISSWDDYFTGAGNIVHLTFKDGRDGVHEYEFLFDNDSSMRHLVSALKSLRAGNYVGRVENGSTPVPAEPTPASASILDGLEGLAADSSGATMLKAKAPQLMPQQRIQTEGSSGPRRTGRNLLVDFDEHDEPATTSQQPSETTRLLSTLEPYGQPVGDGAKKASASMSRDAIVLMARSLFQMFFFSQAEGRHMTAAELDQTAEGVKKGLLQHIVNNARAEGHDDQGIRELATEFHSFFDSEIKHQLAAQQGHTKPRRIQYTADELLSLRGAARNPPDCLANVADLPRPTRQSKGPEPKASTGSQHVPRPTSVQDKGLQNSRWASGAPDLKRANFFTGPKYEKTWSKRSYLEDLEALDPDTKVDVGAEDLANFYFPVPNSSKGRGGAGVVRTQDASESAAEGSEKPATINLPGAAKIDLLRAELAGLTLSSPSQKPVQVASAARAPSSLADAAQPVHHPPQSQPKLCGLAASRHNAGARLASSGKFDFHLPRSARD